MKILRTAPLLLAAFGYCGLANAASSFVNLNGSSETRLYLAAPGQESPLVVSDSVPSTISFRVGTAGKDTVVQYNMGQGWQTGCRTSMIRYDRSKLDPANVPFVLNSTVKGVEQGACRIPGLSMTVEGAAKGNGNGAMVVVSRFIGYGSSATELNVAYTIPSDATGVYGNVVYTDHSMPYVLSMK